MFATGHKSGDIRLWSLTQQKTMHVIPNVHSGKIECVKFTENSSQIVSVGRDHHIKITDLKSQKCLATLEHKDLFLPGHSCEFALSPNGMFLAIGSQSGNLFIFDMKKHKLAEIYEGEHDSPIVGCCWDPSHGSRIASIDESGMLFVWE
jgi:WD40 repeat protein